MSSHTRDPPSTNNDTYKELAPQQPRHREDEGLQVSGCDCTLETSDRDCTLEVDQRAQEMQREAVSGTQASGDIEAGMLEQSYSKYKTRNLFKKNGRVQKSRVCCMVLALIVIIIIIVPSVIATTH
ncbi:hypothetical protein BDV27DRAFT_136838 [Aspergillus caelatus]|uniref:Uncharacterized protein n=1 Tax=Aspergillus caelatus TaxID=61420 RepID=A0A5N6ZPV7_9EURO|nr:uncharacterized protein BDV27DRAFT_136838 [Aspergillus caelatus]KAE8358996.1 hypothetical protein BDV27DRAFT_136838 [Aspergillus caelatus]